MIFSAILLLLVALSLNIPLGYYRQGVPKFSARWFLAIHLPIPFIYIIRTIEHIDISVIPLTVALSIAGQIIGGKIRLWVAERGQAAAR